MAESYVNHPSTSARLISRRNVLIPETPRPARRRAAANAARIDNLLGAYERGYDPEDERAAVRGITVAVALSIPVWGAIAATLVWLV